VAIALAVPHLPTKQALLGRLMSLWSGVRAQSGAQGPVGDDPLLLTNRILSEDDIPPLDRLIIAQWLWGAGHHIPGGEEHVLELVKPFALNPAMSMLDIAAGLGGPARAIAHVFGTYVTGLERDPGLVARGMEMSVLQGMQKRAPINSFDPEKLELRAGSYDCILGRQATFAVANKEKFLRVLIAALKPRGHLLLTDFVIEPKAGSKAEVATWQAHQAQRSKLWTRAQYTDCLTKLGLDIRITEDTTEKYHRRILAGWMRLLNAVDLRSMPKKHVLAILDEAENWVRTIRAIDSGALRMFRFHALAVNRTAKRVLVQQ
jgi:ubiquinone/menaquinone biosynthesis C-methylase UbiE